MKRILAIVLCAALLLSLVSFASAEESVYRFDQPLTLKVSVFDRGVTGQSDVTNNNWTRWIQENFGDPRNITIEWVVIPRSEEVDKLNTLVAAGPSECPDICFTYTESVVTNYVNQGGLWELTDLINEYGPNLKALLGEDVLQYGRFNGGQYAIPARRVVIAYMGTFVRSDWLDELGLSMPTTKEEFYNMLVAFKQAKPDCIPFAMGSDLTAHQMLMYSFFTNLDDRTLATTPMVTWDGMEDYVLFLNKLYHEGLISPDFALNNDNMLFEEVTSGKAGVYTYNYDHPIRVNPGIMNTLVASEPNALLRPLNCFESAADGLYHHISYSPAGIDLIIPMYSDEDHAKAAVMYLDWLSQYPNLYYLQNGVEGLHHKKDEATGLPVALDPTGDDKFNSMQNIDYTLTINGWLGATDEETMAGQSLSYPGWADLFEEEYIVGNTDLMFGEDRHFESIIESANTYGTSLTAYRKEMLTKCTQADPDECINLWRSMVQEYMANGGQQIMDEKIAAWDAAH